MPTKKKTATGPKAKLMKKNLAQLKAQAKRLKIKGFSTKKKEALVNSIMMAQARNNKGKAKKRTMAERDYTPTGTRRSIKRMAKKRGAPANRVMRNPARTGRVMMSEYNGWTNYETWYINLHYDQYFYEIVKEDQMNDEPMEWYDLAEYLKDTIEDLILEDEAGQMMDSVQRGIIEAFLSEVNYREISRNLIEEAQNI